MKKEIPQQQLEAEDLPPTARKKNCLVTVMLVQVNYVNNSGARPLRATIHANAEGTDFKDTRTLEASGTLNCPLWYQEERRNRCGTDVEISYSVDVSLSPLSETSTLDAQRSAIRTYKCPSFKDHEIFSLSIGEPTDDFNVTFDFIFRVTLECREAKKRVVAVFSEGMPGSGELGGN